MLPTHNWLKSTEDVMTGEMPLAASWQLSWDRQQEGYMPDREHRFAAMLDLVAAVTPDRHPVVLDLAGGTGSISIRVLRRFHAALTVLVDVDPVLLTIARASVDDRTTILASDLRSAAWTATLPRRDFDAVLTATALHWIDADRLTALYREVRDLLRPGGVFINADHMHDPGLPSLTKAMSASDRERREAAYATGAAMSWEAWWAQVARDPTLAPLLEQRKQVFDGLHAVEFTPDVSWHLEALQAAGFSEVGLVWRGGTDAAFAAMR